MRKFTDEDAYYFKEGTLYDSFEVLGAFYESMSKEAFFRVFAPNAKDVFVMGDFNSWSYESGRMHKDNHGFFSIKIQNVEDYSEYKYRIITKDDKEIFKADPFAFFSADRPSTNSKVTSLEGFKWEDKAYYRKLKPVYERPVLIYEMHFGSWKKDHNGYYNYRNCTIDLINYLKEHNFTHVEFMPLYEYPLDDSWGYMGTGYYSATSRYGTPKDLMYLINELHKASIGVIFDWVPGHICKDGHGLYFFDGTPLYEYEDHSIRENVTWGTANLDLGKGITRSFMISNALFWMKKFHVDGFRVDAVANIIYFLGNPNTGTNQGALEFLRNLSNQLFKENPCVLLSAEDSTSFPCVTHETGKGGLGFNYKWNMGWMNDVLKYFELDPFFRKHHHHNMTFGISYAYSENFLLPFSHDEVVHGKRSLLNKMPGDYWQKFANYRALLGFWITSPGKKLIFMGGEFGQFIEWDFKRELDFFLKDYPAHQELNLYFKELTAFYKKQKALYEQDSKYDGFKWIDADNNVQSIYSFVRYAKDNSNYLIVILNCTPNTYESFSLGVPELGIYREVFNSDMQKYGGSGVINTKKIKGIANPLHQMPASLTMRIAPLSITILKRSITKEKKNAV